MTSVSTTLPARESLRQEWASYLSFVRSPGLPASAGISPSGGLAAILRILVLDLAFMSVLLAMAAIAMAVGLDLPETALAGLEIDWQLALMVVVLAPVAEEFIFRGWLSGRPGHVLALAIIFAGGFAAMMFAEATTGSEAHASVALAFGGALILSLITLFVLRKRPAMGWFRAIFPAFFWFSTLAFASVHLLNFEEGDVASLLPLVLPQFILGTMLGYLRVNYGLWSAIMLHAMHNGLIIAVVLIAGTNGG